MSLNELNDIMNEISDETAMIMNKHEVNDHEANEKLNGKENNELKSNLINKFCKDFTGFGELENPYYQCYSIKKDLVLNDTNYSLIWNDFISINMDLIQSKLKKTLTIFASAANNPQQSIS